MATDYSVSVMNAESYAVALAVNNQAFLTFIHVYPDELPESATEEEKALNRENARNMNTEILENHVHKICKVIGADALSCACVAIPGDPGRQVAAYASAHQADLVVTGTHGRKGLRDYIFGTHTWNIAKRSSVPLLAIPEDAYYTGIHRIAFASDCRGYEIAAIKQLADLAAGFDASITVLHVIDEPFSDAYERYIFADFKAQVRKAVKYPKLSFKLIGESDDVPGALNTFCMRHSIDLLSVPSDKTFRLDHLLFHHTSQDMALATKIPLLCLPESARKPGPARVTLLEAAEEAGKSIRNRV